MSETGRVQAVGLIAVNTDAHGDCRMLKGTQGLALSGLTGDEIGVRWDWAFRRDPSTGAFEVMAELICPVPLGMLEAAAGA